MKKKIINTIIVAESFFEVAVFTSRKGVLYQKIFASASLNFTQKEKASKIIRSSCQRNKIDFKKDFSCVIPRHLLTIKDFEVPSTNADEIEQMVNFQLQDSLPYRLEDLSIQNLIYPSQKEGYSRIKSIVVQKELIGDLLEIANLSQIKISKIDLSSNVLLNRFRMIYSKEPFFKEASLLINVEGESVDFVFLKNGHALLSRGMLLNKENFKERFLKEFEKSLSLFNHEFSDKLLSVFLWGKRHNLSILADLISKQTNLKTETKEDEDLLKSLAYSSYKQRSKINLMPRAIKEKQRQSLKRRSFLKITFLSIIMVLFLLLALFFDFKEKEKQLAVINSQIEQIESEAIGVQQKINIIEEALAKQAQTLQSLEILKELYLVTQPGIFFNSFSLIPAKSGVIKGQAEELDKILEFVSRLESSPLFENVELKYSSKRRLKEKEIVDFEVAFFISQLPTDKPR
jgi:Tfp pilus assembly protein PilN